MSEPTTLPTPLAVAPPTPAVPPTPPAPPASTAETDETSYFQTFRKPIILIGLMLLAVGLFAYSRMQTALFPEVTFPKITLIADAGQQPIDRMMITVTRAVSKSVYGIS